VDLTLPVRVGIVTLLEQAAALPGAPVTPAQVFGMMQPPETPYPFVRYGVPDALPFRASCINGTTINVPIHSFGEGKTEDQAAEIAAWVVEVLDGKTIQLGDDMTASINWTGGQTLTDPSEKDIWHAYRTFEVDAVA
jgi:hypothetical protein